LIKYIINVRLIAVIPDKNVMKDKIDWKLGSDENFGLKFG
jgi:hypothetical protein